MRTLNEAVLTYLKILSQNCAREENDSEAALVAGRSSGLGFRKTASIDISLCFFTKLMKLPM